ncbi:pentatricopeptide repeat-containing protein At5g48910-like [Phoenix dactylifera]|uniref:Pentatricopeptide repeat-containing protein At5g48910-like n=1 Tax=Phoenix dactylifera TaxID=42345 RepID=A0A8B7BM40_PHODC|nr:pentatricopeptide repeat-containing protein At5g48910-like [Phoenix dactylifera]
MAQVAAEPPPTTTAHPLSQNPNRASLAHLLDTKCHRSLPLLKQAHAILIKKGLPRDGYLAGSLVRNYADPEFSSFDSAIKVFDQVPDPHAFLWNALIRGSLDNNMPRKAISFYCGMIARGGSAPNKFTFPSLFKACAAAKALQEGYQLHASAVKHGLEQDGYVVSAGIQMYAAFGMLIEARRMLDAGDGSDPVCWNAMIDGYMRKGEPEAARDLFDAMPRRNIGSWNAMISGYARHGMIEESRGFFDRMPQRDEVSWSAMIDGYVHWGHFVDALAVFQKMLMEGVKPKKFVFSSVLAASANVGALEQGRWVHAYIERNSVQVDAVLGTSLVDMYAKCGRVDLASEVFEKTASKEIFSWNAIIGGFAMHGHAREAIELFFRMEREKFRPDMITFVNVLSACSHGGLVKEGKRFFNLMKQEYGITPRAEHYGCMVDLLGRAGLFWEAEEMIHSMPMTPNAAVWGALLNACRIHGNAQLAEKVGNILLQLEPENSGRYALLSNIYAKAGRWVDVSKVRKLMKDRGVKTIPGSSLIELDGMIHKFIVGDCTHPSAKEINLMIEEMLERLKLEGYAPNTSQVLFDIDEEEKETALSYHSEKLAIAFGLLNTTPGTTIRIIKNLRVCEDCHLATKLISRVYNREIVVRDRIRYHCFKEGKCSCMDFW